MALVLANRVQETATPNTTVSFTLTGAVSGFQTFAVIGNTNTTYYSATDTAGNWEVGEGTYSTTGPTLARTTIYASSNSGSAVTFPGTVNVFVTYPSGKSVSLDGSGNVSALGTVTSGTWQGSTVGVAYGGTGVTASSGPNSVVLRDANENITVNRINQGLQTVTATGGTTTLTAASDFNQALVGTGDHTFRLPDATTLTDTTTFQFNNNATGTLTIENYAGTTVGTVASGGAAGIALLANATVGGTWDVHAYIPENVTWGTNSLALGSTVISGGTWQGGTIQSGYGGTGLTTFVGANNALYSTSASALTAGTLPVAAGGTGLTSYTLNGVVYASGTGTLATSSALTFDGTNLINSGAYTAPSNGSGAGTKTTIQGSTGTGQAGASGGNGFVEIIGGGGTSTWTSFVGIVPARRRGGINLQAGTAQGDAGGTYVSGSTINISGSAGTNNGTTVGPGSLISITSGSTTKTDGLTSGASTVALSSPNASASSSVTLTAGIYGTSTGFNNGAGISVFGASTSAGGDIRLQPGLASASGATSGKAYVTNPATGANNEILTTGSVVAVANGGTGTSTPSLVAGTNVTISGSWPNQTIAASGGGGGVCCASPTVAGKVYGRTQTCGAGGNVSLGQNTTTVTGSGNIAIGTNAGGGAGGSISIGYYAAGACNQGANAVAIGTCSRSPSANTIAIGNIAVAQSCNGIAIGYNAIANASCSVVIGANGFTCCSGLYIPVIRNNACVGASAVGLGYCTTTKEILYGVGGGVACATPTVAGKVYGRTQSTSFGATALGYQAGASSAGNNSVSVGFFAGQVCQSSNAIAIGSNAGTTNQGTSAIAIGSCAGLCFQCSSAVAIGYQAGQIGQGTAAVAIGYGAGVGFQPSNSIVIAACGLGFNASGVCQFHVKPIRNASGPFTLRYNPTTGEITYN